MPSGRDLELNVVTGVQGVGFDQPAKQLLELADQAKRSGQGLSDLEDEARRASQGVDTSMEHFSRSAHTSLGTKLETDVQGAERKFKKVRQTARDVAAAVLGDFSGQGLTNIASNIAVNVGGLFGTVGVAIGGALSSGIALFTADAEKIKAQAQGIVDALVAGKGQLDEAFIQDKIKEFVDNGSIVKLGQEAEDAALPVGAFLRAVAGDPAAIATINRQLDDQTTVLQGLRLSTDADQIAVYKMGLAHEAAKDRVNGTNRALKSGLTQYDLYKAGIAKPAVPHVDGSAAIREAASTMATIKAQFNTPITIRFRADAAAARAQAVRVRAEIESIMRDRP